MTTEWSEPCGGVLTQVKPGRHRSRQYGGLCLHGMRQLADHPHPLLKLYQGKGEQS